jgi:3-keto-disaccharide hydrolase
MSSRMLYPAAVGVALLLLGTLPSLAEDDPPAKRPSNSLVGRWDLKVHGPDGDYPGWLEVRRSGRTLVGSFVGQFGSARPVAKVEWSNNRLRFAIPPQFEGRNDDLVFDGKLADGVLSGTTTDEKGRQLSWEGRRAPDLKRTSPPRWGEPIKLFNARDLTGWKPRSPSAKNGWTVREGVLVNAAPGNDLLTDRKFTDFQLRAEFRYPKRSNSGIYLRGRYEVQLEDNYGEEPECHKIGGVYGFLTPCINSAKKAGEWQTLEITLVGRQVTIVLNGERVIDRQTIPGITGGALDSDEAQPGPILLQGDHGRVEFRKITLTPALEESKSAGR